MGMYNCLGGVGEGAGSEYNQNALYTYMNISNNKLKIILKYKTLKIKNHYKLLDVLIYSNKLRHFSHTKTCT